MNRLTFFLALLIKVACNTATENSSDLKTDTITVKENENSEAGNETVINEPDWDSPVVKYEEIGGDEVNVRSRNNYSIYSLDENEIFISNTADLDEKGFGVLEKVVSSLNKRYKEGDIRIYRAEYDEDVKNKLADARAKVVRDYLITVGQISGTRVSFSESNQNNPVGQTGRRSRDNIEIVVLATK